MRNRNQGSRRYQKDFVEECKEVKPKSRQLNKKLEDAKFDAQDLQNKYDEEHRVRASLGK